MDVQRFTILPVAPLVQILTSVPPHSCVSYTQQPLALGVVSLKQDSVEKHTFR